MKITSLFRLKIFVLVILQNKSWSTGVVHGPGVHALYTSLKNHRGWVDFSEIFENVIAKE